MNTANKIIGIFLLLLNIACALWNFGTFAATGHGVNLVIGLMNAAAFYVLLCTLIRYWDGY